MASFIRNKGGESLILLILEQFFLFYKKGHTGLGHSLAIVPYWHIHTASPLANDKSRVTNL